MDLYLTTLAIGGVGLVAMAAGGVMHVGHGHAGGHGHGAGHAHGTHAHGHGGHASKWSASRGLLALMSPRTLFSAALGFGVAGMALRGVFNGGVLLFGAALGGAVIFERLLVAPIWRFVFRFESKPALTLESAYGSDARAVTAFDANGQGLVAVEVDGQLVQLLATLQTSDRELHTKVAAGTLVRIEEVDAERNRCTVSVQ